MLDWFFRSSIPHLPFSVLIRSLSEPTTFWFGSRLTRVPRVVPTNSLGGDSMIFRILTVHIFFVAGRSKITVCFCGKVRVSFFATYCDIEWREKGCLIMTLHFLSDKKKSLLEIYIYREKSKKKKNMRIFHPPYLSLSLFLFTLRINIPKH